MALKVRAWKKLPKNQQALGARGCRSRERKVSYNLLVTRDNCHLKRKKEFLSYKLTEAGSIPDYIHEKKRIEGEVFRCLSSRTGVEKKTLVVIVFSLPMMMNFFERSFVQNLRRGSSDSVEAVVASEDGAFLRPLLR